MEVESFTLGKLPFPVDKRDTISLHVFSSKIYILKITLEKQLFLYCFDDKKANFISFQLIWNSATSFSDCAIISSDGYMCIKTVENDFYFFNIKNTTVEIDSKLLFHQFKGLLDPVEFADCDLTINPIICTQRSLTLCLNNQWLLTIECLASKEPYIISCFKLENLMSSFVANKEYVFSITAEGELYICKIADGTILQKLDVLSWLPRRESYRLMDANEEPNTILALMDTNSSVYIIDLSFSMSPSNNLKFDDSQSVCSASSSLSYKTSSSYSSVSRTSSVANSSKQLSLKYTAADDLWLSYLEKLQKKQNNLGSIEKRHLNPVIKLELQHEDKTVVKVNFTDVGVSVWTRPGDTASDGFCRLFDKKSGHMIFSTIVPEHGQVLLLQAPTVTLDLFILNDSLCLPLSSVQRHSFINKMLQCIDSQYIKMLLEGWEDMLNPSSLLRSALSEGQLDTVHLALNLHSHLFSSEIVGEGLEQAQTKDVLNALIDVVKSSTATEQFIRQIKGLQLTHSYRLLGILDDVKIPSFMQSEVAALRNQIMESIVAARAGLESVEGSAPVPPEHSVEWVLWEGMSDTDVVRVGVTRLSAVQCFLAVKRGWTPEELSGEKFKDVVLSSAKHLLEKRDIEGASHLISHTGFSVEEEMRKICLNSLDKNLIDFIIESQKDLWSKTELEAWDFLTLVTEVIKRYKCTLKEEFPLEDLQLSVRSIIKITDDKRQEIITELFFRTWDETLKGKLKSEDSWKYLIESNCVEGIQVWLGIKQPLSLHPWPVNLFKQWPVTQQMINSVCNFNSSESTKQIVYNCLSLKGLFCSESKKYPQKILRRLAETRSLMFVENFVGEEISKNFLSFVCNYNLIEFAVYIHQQLPSILSLHNSCNERHQVKWLDFWQSLIDIDGEWSEENILHAIQRTNDYLITGNHDAYYMDHPLILLALSLIQDKPLQNICNDPLAISPLLAIGLPSNQPDDRRETTLYSLLSGTSAFHTDTLFLWQRDHLPNKQKEIEHEFPNFSNEKLSIQYGHKQCLTYIDHLKQGRPSFAFVQFFFEFSNPQGSVQKRMQKRGTNIAHGLALQQFKDKDVGCSCVAFTEMLSRDSTPLRIHLACLDAICNSQLECGTNEIRTILHGIVMNKQESAECLLKLLLEALHPELVRLCGNNDIACLKLWQIPVMFANLHQLSLPESFLLHSAENNNWLLFFTIISLFNYPKWQVIQLVKNFKSVSLREHFNYVLQLKVNSQGHISNSGCFPRIVKNVGSLKQLFTCVAEYGNSSEQLLTQARALRCPGFALLATCFQKKCLVACFSEWLAASIPKGHDSCLPANPEEWGSESVSLLLEQVVGLSYIKTLHHALLIFFPIHPLFLFAKFLMDTVEDKIFTEVIFDVEEFIASLSKLADDEENFMSSKNWVLKTVVHLCAVVLIKCFPSSYLQKLFLRTICSTKLNSCFPGTNPDFQLLLSLTECLEKDGLTLDFASICQNHEHFQYEKQLEKLIYCHKFDIAHCFATTAGLPHDLILVSEWKEKAKSRGLCDLKFWELCDAAFTAGGMSVDDAFSFYLEEVDFSKSVNERYTLLKYALKWITSRPLHGITKHQELSILHSMYECFLQENFNIELVIEDLFFHPLKCFRKDVVSQDTLDWFTKKSTPTLTLSQVKKLDSVIGKLFSVGDVATVWSLEALFNLKNKDSMILDACLELAEDIWTTVDIYIDDRGCLIPDNLSQNISQLVSECSSRSKILKSPDLFSSSRMSQSMLSSYSLLEEGFVEIDTEENIGKEEILRVVGLLVENANCSSHLVKYIQSALRISKKFNLQYKEVIKMQNPLVLIEKGCEDLHLAKDVIILANLPSDQIIFYLCSQIVKAVSSSEKWLNNCGDLSDILSLAEDPLRLGKLLLTAAVSLTQSESFQQTVELLILSHRCFTRTCNMEGISKVLKMCQKLTAVLLQNCQWSLMVRLLTGIGRYNEMRYIFQLLKDNQQFESLLSKGLDKYSGLKSATLNFVRGDKELFTLVALHFRMYSELAAMFEENAVAVLDSLEYVEVGKIVRSDHNVQSLQAVIKAFSHAAQHCVQAKKLKKANNIVYQAELAALQLSFLHEVEIGKQTNSLLNLDKSQVESLITNVLSYDEACIVSHAYNISVDWSAALYQQFIVKNNHHYFTAWSRHHDLNNTIVQDIARRFQKEKTLSDLMVKNMKQFIQMISQIDLRYRVCSQMGFKDLLQSLLSEPCLPYLKDTVWQKGFKTQHM